MHIVKRPNQVQSNFRTYLFPYRIGIPRSAGQMSRRWRPVDTSPLTGNLKLERDPFAVTDKLARLGADVRGASHDLQVEWIDVADGEADKLEICLGGDHHLFRYSYEVFEKSLMSAFGLEVR